MTPRVPRAKRFIFPPPPLHTFFPSFHPRACVIKQNSNNSCVSRVRHVVQRIRRLVRLERSTNILLSKSFIRKSRPSNKNTARTTTTRNTPPPPLGFQRQHATPRPLPPLCALHDHRPSSDIPTRHLPLLHLLPRLPQQLALVRHHGSDRPEGQCWRCGRHAGFCGRGRRTDSVSCLGARVGSAGRAVGSCGGIWHYWHSVGAVCAGEECVSSVIACAGVVCRGGISGVRYRLLCLRLLLSPALLFMVLAEVEMEYHWVFLALFTAFQTPLVSRNTRSCVNFEGLISPGAVLPW